LWWDLVALVQAIACGLLHSIEERGIGKFAWIEKLEDVTGFTIL